jgi:hypothetical protein
MKFNNFPYSSPFGKHSACMGSCFYFDSSVLKLPYFSLSHFMISSDEMNGLVIGQADSFQLIVI